MTAPQGESLTCCSCGYDLRGLDPKGACPECAAPVAQSIAAAAPLSRALGAAAAVGCLLLGAGMLGAAALWAFHVRSFADPWKSYPGTAQGVVVVAGFFAAIAMAAGAFLATQAGPRGLALVARGGLIVQVAAAPMLMCAWTSGEPWLPLILLPGSAVSVAGLSAALLAVASLARRSSRPALAVQLRIAAIGVAGSAAALCAAASFWYVPDDPRGVPASLVGLALGVGLLGTAAFGLWAIVLLAAIAMLGGRR